MQVDWNGKGLLIHSNRAKYLAHSLTSLFILLKLESLWLYLTYCISILLPWKSYTMSVTATEFTVIIHGKPGQQPVILIKILQRELTLLWWKPSSQSQHKTRFFPYLISRTSLFCTGLELEADLLSSVSWAFLVTFGLELAFLGVWGLCPFRCICGLLEPSLRLSSGLLEPFTLGGAWRLSTVFSGFRPRSPQ